MPKAAFRNAANSASAGGDDAEQGAPAANPATPTTAKIKPTSWANFSGGTGSRSVTGPSRGRHEGGEQPAVGVPARAADGADGEDHGLQAQNDRGGERADRRDDQRRTRTAVVTQAANRGPRTSTRSGSAVRC